MNRKISFWILGILVVVVITGGVYAYNIYTSVSSTLDKIHKPLNSQHSTKRIEEIKGENAKPISILLMGTDERGAERGRSDSLMLLTLNSKQKSMKLLSIPRDTYTEMVGKDKKDKINHAYAFGGIDMAVKSIENFIGIPVDYYITVNMKGFKEVVDVIQGVDVENDLEFSLEGMHFEKGNIHLDGEQALKYTRMRKEDPNGDFGRQTRQRQLLEALVKKGANSSLLTNYSDLLKIIEKNVKTNLTKNQMLAIQKEHKNTILNKEYIQIPGEGHLQEGIWYYFVSKKDRQDLSAKLKEHLEVSK
ncbi:TPA: LytR family transcriptional regulator [Bacillus cereus]|nr:LytR family transcriptional regulator [Bacillus cereus]